MLQRLPSVCCTHVWTMRCITSMASMKVNEDVSSTRMHKYHSSTPSVVKKHVSRRQPSTSSFHAMDHRLRPLFSPKTRSSDYVRLCDDVQDKKSASFGSDIAWNVALRQRFAMDDMDGANALFTLVHNLPAENMNETQWSDLFFILLRQPMCNKEQLAGHLRQLEMVRGQPFVDRVVVSLLNGCAGTTMFSQAHFLLLYLSTHMERALQHTPRLPSVLSYFFTKLHQSQHEQLVVDITKELLLAHQAPWQDQLFLPPAWIAMWKSFPSQDLHHILDRFMSWCERIRNDPRQKKTIQLEKVVGAAIQACIRAKQPVLAVELYQTCLDQTKMDENIFVNVLSACNQLQDKETFYHVYDTMVSHGIARSGGFGSAIRFGTRHKDVEFVKKVLKDAFATEKRVEGKWILPLIQYNDALCCFTTCGAYDQAQELVEYLVHHTTLQPDHHTMLQVIECCQDSPFSEISDVLDQFARMGITPNQHVYTTLIAACNRRGSIKNAIKLIKAMRQENGMLDIYACSTIATTYAKAGQVKELIGLLEEMKTQHVDANNVFANVVMEGLYESQGIDVCFSLLQDMKNTDLTIPQPLYQALVRIGTEYGFIERTLHVAYNMECDGFPLPSHIILQLIHASTTTRQVQLMLETFVLLHQGTRPSPHSGQHSIESDHPRFSLQVYQALIDILPRRQDRLKVKQLAREVGYPDI